MRAISGLSMARASIDKRQTVYAYAHHEDPVVVFDEEHGDDDDLR